MTADHDHHAHDAESVGVAVLTVSSSRDRAADESGDAIAAALEGTDATVAARDLVTDDESTIRETVTALRDRDAVEAIVTTGGTGLTPDDVTVEAVRPLFDRAIPGFGEQFRARSVEDVGPMAMLSRATAGVTDGVPVFCLPGSEQAARFGTAELVVPILGHAVTMAQGGHHHHGGDHE